MSWKLRHIEKKADSAVRKGLIRPDERGAFLTFLKFKFYSKE